MSSKLNKQESDKLKKLASVAGISLAIILSLLKAVASLYTGSLSVLSSMVDSVSDVLGSAITFVAVKLSSRPATHTYRYGYGKAESLSALFQSIFIAGSGIYVLYDGINRFIHPRPIEQTSFGLIVMTISLAATFVLLAFQKYVIKKTDSQAIKADREHYIVDVLTNSSIIMTLFVVKFFDWVWFDSFIAVVISLYLLYNAYNLARDAIRNLLDKELSERIRKKVENIVMSYPESKGIHDLRTRDIGGVYVFEFHLELDGSLSLNKSHEYAHHVEDMLLREFPDSQITIHQEPAGILDDRLDNKVNCCKKK